MTGVATLERAMAPVPPRIETDDSLDRHIAAAWSGLLAHRSVRCPICGAEMTPAYGAHALPIGGRCGSCGSELH